MENNQNYSNSTEGTNRKIQDSMFTDLFKPQENLLDLYKILHPEDMSVRLADIRNVTLTNILTGGIISDLGMLVRGKLIILTEHQSTVNKNMPVRVLLYYAEELKRYLFADEKRKKQLYRRGLIKLPSPEFYVILS